MTRRMLALPAIALLVLAGAACGDDDDDDGVADRVEQEAEDVRDSAEDLRDDAEEELDDVTEDAAEAAARTLAANGGEDAFAQADHPLEGELACDADAVDGTDGIEVTCTGTTEDGQDAVLTGTTSETPGASATTLEGDFAGTVAGDEVFTTERLGEEDETTTTTTG